MSNFDDRVEKFKRGWEVCTRGEPSSVVTDSDEIAGWYKACALNMLGVEFKRGLCEAEAENYVRSTQPIALPERVVVESNGDVLWAKTGR